MERLRNPKAADALRKRLLTRVVLHTISYANRNFRNGNESQCSTVEKTHWRTIFFSEIPSMLFFKAFDRALLNSSNSWMNDKGFNGIGERLKMDLIYRLLV